MLFVDPNKTPKSSSQVSNQTLEKRCAHPLTLITHMQTTIALCVHNISVTEDGSTLAP